MSEAQSEVFPGDGAATGGRRALIQFQLLENSTKECIVALSGNFRDLGSNIAVLQNEAEVIHGSFVIGATKLTDGEVRLRGDEAQGEDHQSEGTSR